MVSYTEVKYPSCYCSSRMSALPTRTITRNRERLACKECRRRKLRCDRSVPCSSCVRRGDGAACSYQRLAGAAGPGPEQLVETEARLEHLEQLVQQLSQPRGVAAGVPSSGGAVPGPESECRVAAPSDAASAGELTYSGSTHWSAMLDDIQQLRLAIPLHAPYVGDQEDDDGEYTGFELIFGGGAPLPFEDVLARYLPSRRDADRMISSYFRAQAIAVPFIHTSHFRAQYQEFWEDPGLASPLWVSILFSICHIATNTLNISKPTEAGDSRFSVAAAHCLVAGRYFRPKAFAVEALLVFGQAQCLTRPELPPDIGTLFGIIVRCATRMGYHRDPEDLHISVFEKEMRRRTWSLCMQLDLLTSFHLGLPSNVQFPTWDTKVPQAVTDSEFDEHSTELPAPRADLETSGMAFYVAKHRFMVIFEKILRHTMDTNPDPAGVHALDAEMRREFDSLPEPWRPRPMSESVVDPAHLIVTRLCCSFAYYKCLCVLHRPYVTQGRVESILVCYESASGLLRDFIDAFYEFTPGGQAETERWFLGSLTWHDFLFSVMVLCLVLCATSGQNAYPGVDAGESLDLLRRARSLCAEQESRRHKDTRRVVALVDAIVDRFGAISQNPPSSLTMDGLGSTEMQVSGSDSSSIDMMTGLGQDPSWSYFDDFLTL